MNPPCFHGGLDPTEGVIKRSFLWDYHYGKPAKKMTFATKWAKLPMVIWGPGILINLQLVFRIPLSAVYSFTIRPSICPEGAVFWLYRMSLFGISLFESSHKTPPAWGGVGKNHTCACVLFGGTRLLFVLIRFQTRTVPQPPPPPPASLFSLKYGLNTA